VLDWLSGNRPISQCVKIIDLPNDQKIALQPVNEIGFIRQIKV